jgi:hypothetical protein
MRRGRQRAICFTHERELVGVVDTWLFMVWSSLSIFFTIEQAQWGRGHLRRAGSP